jgi:hypothetical protein
LRRAGDAHAPAFALPAQGTRPRRRFARIVAIRQHDHIAHLAREIERPKARGRKRGPCRMVGRLHCGETGLDAFPNHQHVPGIGETHCAAAAGTQHHLLRMDWSFAATIAGKEGAMDGNGRSIYAVRDQRHHRRPDAARGMLQPDVETDGRRR